MTKVVFMGTPIFSVSILEGLIKNYDVIGVVSQPDKLVGRKKILTPTPVKETALKNNIPVFQPIKIKEDYNKIKEWNPDIIITCAYGQIIPQEVLDIPSLGCINVHASLLPKLRGGAPIQKSIIEGYSKTGITIMDMIFKMDAGDIISQRETTILDTDNYQSLHDRLSQIGTELLLETLPSIIDKTATRTKQDEELVTYGWNIKREEEKIDLTKSTKEIYNQIRGLSPKPGTYLYLEDKIIKIYASTIGINKPKQPGEITNIYKDGIGISTSDGEIIITKIQPEGKKEVLVKDYLNGLNKEELLTKKFK